MEQRRQEEQLRREAAELKLRCSMQDLRTRGYPTLFSFINAFLQTKDPILSSKVSDDWHPFANFEFFCSNSAVTMFLTDSLNCR